jgi:hypothetical protein
MLILAAALTVPVVVVAIALRSSGSTSSVTAGALTPHKIDSIDARVHRQYPRQRTLAVSVSDSDRYSKKDLLPGVYRYSIAGLSAEISRADGRVVQPATFRSPTTYEFDLTRDGSWESFPLLADGRIASSAFHESYKNGVYQLTSDGVAAPPTKIVPLGPLHDFSSRAIEILLDEAAKNRKASTDASTTMVSAESVKCMTKLCVHVESRYGVKYTGGQTVAWRASGNVERDDLVFDPDSGLVHYHLVSLNEQPITEFKLLAVHTAASAPPALYPECAASQPLTLRAFDHGTSRFVDIDRAYYCRRLVALSPAPGSHLSGSLYVEDGKVTAQYRSITDVMSVDARGASVDTAVESEDLVPTDQLPAALRAALNAP